MSVMKYYPDAQETVQIMRDGLASKKELIVKEKPLVRLISDDFRKMAGKYGFELVEVTLKSRESRNIYKES